MDSKATYLRAKELAESNSIEDAFKLYTELINSPTTEVEYKKSSFNDLAVILFNATHFNDSLNYLSLALKISPNDVVSIGNLKEICQTSQMQELVSKEYTTIFSQLEPAIPKELVGKGYITLQIGEKPCWPAWGILTWHLKMNMVVIQIGDTSDPKVPHCIDLRGQLNHVGNIGLISKSVLHLTEELAFQYVPAIFNVPSITLRKNPSEEIQEFYGKDNLIISTNKGVDDVTLDDVYQGMSRVTKKKVIATKKSETSKCRKRLLPYCKGEGMDIGHGGDKIVTEARGVDFFKQSPQDIIGDAKDLSAISDESLGFLYSSHCLEDMENPAVVLSEWLKKIKVGGHLLLYLPDEEYYHGNNDDHQQDFHLSDVLSTLEDLGGTEVVHTGRHNENEEYSFEVVAKKIKNS